MDVKKETGWLLKEKYSGRKTAGFYKDIKRFNAGEPLDYVIGFTEFLGCKIDLSKKPFIPRPETEYWVGEAIKDSRFKIQDLRILDIFAGSGCIGMAILKNVKNTKVVFVDKNKKCLEQIKINLKLNNVKCKVIQSDVFSKIKGKFDYIFANPPYAPTTTRNEVEDSVLKFEPHVALFGGKDGLLYTRRLLTGAKKHLNYGGKIFIEFNSRQKEELKKLIRKYGYKNYQFHKDQYGRWRWVAIGC